jgi:erythromycin esterase
MIVVGRAILMEKIRYKRSLAILLSAGLVVFLGREVYVAIAVPQKVKEQLNQYAIPLKTIDPDDDLADLEPIGRAIGDARIVGLGEATHGTSDFFTMKHRLIRYLVERKGFTVVAFEGSWPRVEVIDEYVKTGKGSAGDSVKSLFLGLRTHEVTNLLQWMRDYNRTASQKISFAGFDSQSDEDGIHRVLNYVCQYTPKEFLWFYQQYAERLKPFKFSAFDEKNPEVFWRQVQSYFYMQLPHSDSVVQRLERSKDKFVQSSNVKEFNLARYAAVRAVQGAKVSAFGYEGTLAIRDQIMADNVKWLIEEAYPGQKIIEPI